LTSGVATQVTETTLQAIVTGLQPGTLYYIAIRNSDNQCDVSAISNVATFTTRSNAAPVVTNPLPDITLRDVAKETAYYIGDVFTDDDGDDMIYEISVSSARVATARLKDNSVLIKPVAAGKTTLTLTADDGNTGRTSFSLSLNITQNHAPEFRGLLTDTTLIPKSGTIVIDLAKFASDPDDDPLLFYVQPTKSDVVNTDINGSILTIDPRHHGNETLLVTASDPYAAKNTKPIHITVEQKYAPDKANRLLVYPNPTNEILWYSYILSEPASVYINIVNSTGQIMYQTPVEKRTTGTYYNNVNLQNWGAGMYLVQYFIGGKLVDTKKVVKQ
jgi:hypothetical protein